MHNRRKCKQCFYHGFTGTLGVTCDFILITGKSRIMKLTQKEKEEPCKFFCDKNKTSRRVPIAYSQNTAYHYGERND